MGLLNSIAGGELQGLGDKAVSALERLAAAAERIADELEQPGRTGEMVTDRFINPR